MAGKPREGRRYSDAEGAAQLDVGESTFRRWRQAGWVVDRPGGVLDVAATMAHVNADRHPTRGGRPDRVIGGAVQDLPPPVETRGSPSPGHDAASATTPPPHRTYAFQPADGPANPTSSLAQARLANEVLKAKRARMDLEAREGKLVPIDAVSELWFRKVRSVRDRFLDLPSRVAAPLVSMAQNEAARNAENAVRVLLDGEIRALLTEMSEEPSQAGRVRE